MRIEKAPRIRGVKLALNPTVEGQIYEIINNDPTAIRAAYPELGNSGWINGFMEELVCETEIYSLPEIPPPQFLPGDNNTATTMKGADSEWKVPRAHLQLWIANEPNQNKQPNWLYKGKVSLLKIYGYPNRRYRLADYFTDNLARGLQEHDRIGLSLQWADRIDYFLLSSVEYFDDPNGVLKLSRFTLDLTATAIKVVGFRTLDGAPLPIEPTYSVAAHPTDTTKLRLIVNFTNEQRISPNMVQVLVEFPGNRLKLAATDIITIDGTWRQEVVSFQPDFTPTPIFAQSVTQTTRAREQTIYTATITRQSVLFDRPTRSNSLLINRGATNNLFYKLGADVTTSPLIQPGQTVASGGYHGVIGPGASVNLPAGYAGTISVVTSAGQTQCLAEETYLVSGA